MSTANSNNKFKQVVAMVKSVPVEAYLLVGLNVVMLTALICEDLPLHYLLGMALFVVLLVEAVGSALGCCKGPSSLISEGVSGRVRELQERLLSYFSRLRVEELQSKSVNVIIAILLVIYTGSHLNGTLEIFLIVNTLYCLVFLPKQTDSCLDCCHNCWEGLVSKIQYRK